MAGHEKLIKKYKKANKECEEKYSSTDLIEQNKKLDELSEFINVLSSDWDEVPEPTQTSHLNSESRKTFEFIQFERLNVSKIRALIQDIEKQTIPDLQQQIYGFIFDKTSIYKQTLAGYIPIENDFLKNIPI